ncbi:MAG: NAD(P)H-dependent oxidoreductase [Bauldia sp.]
MVKVAVFVGSLRRDSINRALAKALAKLAAPTLEFELVDISDLPHYNNDLWEGTPPAAVTRMKHAMEAADAVLFITPEYNRSVPGLIKDVVDWASRPYGQNSLKGKPGAVAGASGGKIGTAVAQSHLRNSLVVLDVALMGQPEAYITVTPGLIDVNFDVTDEAVRVFLVKFLAAFADWIGKIAGIVMEEGQPDATRV